MKFLEIKKVGGREESASGYLSQRGGGGSHVDRYWGYRNREGGTNEGGYKLERAGT